MPVFLAVLTYLGVFVGGIALVMLILFLLSLAGLGAIALTGLAFVLGVPVVVLAMLAAVVVYDRLAY